jgi:hypothetical protein
MANIKLTELSELISVDNSNTIIYAADLSVSPNVSHYLRIGSISSLTDYSIANAAFLRANTAFSVGFNANNALNIANLGFDKANVSNIQANTATDIATSAFIKANDSTILAQSGFNTGNTAFVHANASFILANTTSITTSSAFSRANLAFSHATAAYNYANTLNVNASTILAQLAYNRANNSVFRGGDFITGVINAPTAANNTSNTMLSTTQFVQNAISSRPSTNIGAGQTWQDLTLVRSAGTTYTNNTGKPIQVMITTYKLGGSAATQFFVGDVLIGFTDGTGTNDYAGSSATSFIVPNGSTYRASAALIQHWAELR